MIKLLKEADLKLNKETLGLELKSPLQLNYGVVRRKGSIDKIYVEADKELMKNKTLTYKKLKKMNIDRRK